MCIRDRHLGITLGTSPPVQPSTTISARTIQLTSSAAARHVPPLHLSLPCMLQAQTAWRTRCTGSTPKWEPVARWACPASMESPTTKASGRQACSAMAGGASCPAVTHSLLIHIYKCPSGLKLCFCAIWAARDHHHAHLSRHHPPLWTDPDIFLCSL